jgi:hypothetical protein
LKTDTENSLKISLRLILGILACLILAAGAYFWATGLMDSVYAYRSPLHNQPPAPELPIGKPVTRRVVFVLIDALREDTSKKTEVMPFLNEIRQRAASATMRSRPPSYSEPGYSVLLTGAWPDLSDGPTINLDYDQIPTWTQDNLFSAAHRTGLKTAVSGYYWFQKLIPQDTVDVSFYTPGEDKAADRQVVDAALPWLQKGGAQLVLIHIDQVDYAGHHEGGPRDPRWDAAAHRADDLLREIAAQLDLTQDTLFVCSDHGQIDRGGHGGQDPITLIEPFILVGAGVQPGQYPDVSMVDVAPTLAALLGANLPASNQGNPLTGMLKLTAKQASDVQTSLIKQQKILLETYTAAMGSKANFQTGSDSVASTQAAMSQILNTRLNQERWPRFLLALVIALVPAALWLRKSKGVWPAGRLWLLAGALLYILLYNLRYAVLSHRTYSLSSVGGATELILYTAVTVAGCLFITWLGIAFTQKIFSKEPSAAANLVLDLTLTILYLLMLPVLFSYGYNGALVTWALPDFASMFVAFLSLIQILFVAIVGLVLCGITAGVAVFVQRR